MVKRNTNSTNINSSFANEKLPPQNIEAEESTLGALIIDNNAIVKIADILYPEDFYLGVKPLQFQIQLYA